MFGKAKKTPIKKLNLLNCEKMGHHFLTTDLHLTSLSGRAIN
jgi:hypothetical protein